MNAASNPSPTSKLSFRIDGFGRAELIGAKEIYHFGIIPGDQGVYFLNAGFFQMIHKFINQVLTDTLMLMIGRPLRQGGCRIRLPSPTAFRFYLSMVFFDVST